MQNGSRRSRLVGWGIGLTALLAIATAGSRAQTTQQVLLQETFRGPDSASSVVTLDVNAPGFPCLTADPTTSTGNSTVRNCNLASPDPVGSGALRFTSTTEQQASGFVADTSLPTSQGLEITFTQYQYGGYGLGGPGSPGGADGISFFMAVAPPSPQAIGPQGGALGYASSGTASGLPGAWLGVGLDAFGNFSNPAFGSPSCPAKSWAGFNPDSITVRGPGHSTNGYCLLASSADQLSSASLGGFGLSAVAYAAELGSGLSLRGDDRASSARDITIRITPTDGLFRVYIDDGTGPMLATSGALPTSYYDPVTGAIVSGLPPRVTFGFSASTGSATDIHEISDLTATTTSGAVPILGLTKTASSSSVSPGQAFTYVITPRVVGPAAEPKPLTVRVTDDVPTGVVLSGTPFGTSWSCTPTSSTAFKCVYTNATSIAAGTTLPSITVPVIVDSSVPNGTTIVNTATVLSDDAAGPVEATASVTVVTVPPLVITTTTLPGGTVGTAYSAALVATGGTGTRTWSLATGTLPAGLTLSGAGAISGTPTASGTASFTARVTDQVGATTTKALSIAIATGAQPLVITTTTLPGGTVSTAYSATLVATGGTGPYSWTIASGALPGGVSVSNGGVLSGTPTTAGTFAVTVRATDTLGAFATRALSVVVAAPVTITTTVLPGGGVGTAYSTTLAAAGGTAPYAWVLASGRLPVGLALSGTGVISGTPTTPQTATIQVRVTATGGGSAQRSFTIVISQLAITTTALPVGQLPLPYLAQFQASGGIGALRWTLDSGALPAGLTMSTAGRIAGLPTTAGVFAIFVRVTDSVGATSGRGFNIQIRAEPLVVTTVTLPPGEQGEAYRAGLNAVGGTGARTWSLTAGALPLGVSLSPQGLVVGTPAVPGTFFFWVRVTDAAGQADGQRLTLTLLPAVAINTTELAGGTVGTPYSATLARTGGFSPYSWTLAAGSLPPGLTLSGAGVISGTPTTVGTSPFTVRVRDGLNAVALRALSIVVAPRAPVEKAYIPTVLNGSPGISVFDVARGTLLTRIPLPSYPDEVVSSHDGSRVYFLLAPQGGGVIDTTTDAVGMMPDTGSAEHLRVSPDDSKVFFVSYAATTSYLRVLNGATLSVVANHALGYAAHALTIAPDGQTAAYVSQNLPGQPSSRSLRVISTATGQIIAARSVEVGAWVDALITPSGNRLVMSKFAGNQHDIVQFSLPGLAEVRRSGVPTGSFWLAGLDNSFAYSLAATNAVVSAVELGTGAVRSRSLGSFGTGLVIDVSGLNGYTMVDGRVLTRIRLSSFVATSVATLGPEFQQTTNFFRFAIARVGS